MTIASCNATSGHGLFALISAGTLLPCGLQGMPTLPSFLLLPPVGHVWHKRTKAWSHYRAATGSQQGSHQEATSFRGLFFVYSCAIPHPSSEDRALDSFYSQGIDFLQLLWTAPRKIKTYFTGQMESALYMKWWRDYVEGVIAMTMIWYFFLLWIMVQ